MVGQFVDDHILYFFSPIPPILYLSFLPIFHFISAFSEWCFTFCGILIASWQPS